MGLGAGFSSERSGEFEVLSVSWVLCVKLRGFRQVHFQYTYHVTTCLLPRRKCVGF